MFIVLLNFSDKRNSAGKYLDDHKAWLQQGFEDGIFIMSGSLQEKSGGGIIANNVSESVLRDFVNADPFVVEGIVSAEIIQLIPNKFIPELAFLQS